MKTNLVRLLAAFCLALGLLGLFPASPARAGTATVTNCDDSGDGSLRKAVADATGGDTLNFNLDCPAASPITLTSSIDIDKNLEVSGEGHEVVISGNNATRIFTIQYDMIVTLKYLTLKNAGHTDGSDGGAIYDNGSFLTISHVAFADNAVSGSGADGGAIHHHSHGSFTISDSTFSGSSAERYGGAIDTMVNTTITDSTFTDNTAYRGGALNVLSYDLSLERVTMNGNTAIGPSSAYGQGGAIYLGFGTLNINNSTLSGNGSDDYTNVGGAIYTYDSTVTIKNSTIVNNLLSTDDPGFNGGGIWIQNATLNYYNTILANNTTDDCNASGTMTIANNVNNLVEVSVGCGAPTLTSDPNLGALADNGGTTWTHALLPGSPAIDAGDNATCLADDQREVTRPLDGDHDTTATCDIGAFEYTNSAPVITEGDSVSVTMDEDGSPTSFALTLNATDADGDTLTWSISTPAGHGTASASGTGTSKSIGYTPAANYNGPDSFVVQVNDGHGGTDTTTVNVTINPVNDAPTNLSLSNNTLSENRPAGTAVGTLSSTDPDTGQTFTYSLSSAAGCSGTNNSSFQISGSSLKTKAVFNYESKHTYTVCIQTNDGHGGAFKKQFTITVNDLPETFLSTGSQDGWVLESTETSGVGGTKDASGSTFYLGDNAQDKQYRSILSFDTTGLPDNAVITKVTLKIKKQGLVGANPFTTHNNIAVDIRKGAFGGNNALQLTDFQAAASKNAAGTITNTPVSGWYTKTWTSGIFSYINKTGLTQFRLRFQKDDNDDRGADYLKFYSGNYATTSYRPVLLIEYYVP